MNPSMPLIIPQKIPKSAPEEMHCTPNQKYPLFLLEAFQLRKIKNIHLKELLIATRNLSYEMHRWMHVHCHQEIKNAPNEFVKREEHGISTSSPYSLRAYPE